MEGNPPDGPLGGVAAQGAQPEPSMEPAREPASTSALQALPEAEVAGGIASPDGEAKGNEPRKGAARGASASELDHLRATVKVKQRGSSRSAVRPRASAAARASQPPPPVAGALQGPELSRIIEEGRELLELDPKTAHDRFEAAYRRNLNDARVLSFYGLTLVLVEGDRQRGIRFCEEAVRRGPPTTEMLVNLAKALVLTRNKEQAVRALRKAQELAPDDPRVSAEFVALGLRRPPPIPWLPRSFCLNRWIGKFTWRMAHRKGALL